MLDAIDNSLGNCFTEPGGFHAIPFRVIADEAAFNKDGRQRRVTNDVKSSIFHQAIHGPGPPNQAVLDVLRQASAFLAGIKGFQAADFRLPSVVVVDAHENGVPVAVSGADALGERNEIIAAAGHHRLIAHAFQFAFKAESGVERQVLLVNLAPLTSAIVSAVAGIDHDRPKICSICGTAEAAECRQGEEFDECFHRIDMVKSQNN